jgi:hypothetical protein
MLRSGAGCLGLFRRSRRRELHAEGLEFASTRDARVDASRALAEMVKGAMPDGPRTAMAIEARGENREPLLKVQIVFEVAPLA